MEIKFIPIKLCALKHTCWGEIWHPGSYFRQLRNNFWGLKYLNSWFGSGSRIFLTLDQGWKNLDPGSGISIPDPQHGFLFFLELVKSDKTRLMWIRVRLEKCKTSSNESMHLAGTNVGSRLKIKEKITFEKCLYLAFPLYNFMAFSSDSSVIFLMWILLCSPYFMRNKNNKPVCKLWQAS